MSWYYIQSSRRQGPIDDQALLQMVAQGALNPTDLVWRAGMEGWQQAATIPGLLEPPPQPATTPLEAKGGVLGASPVTTPTRQEPSPKLVPSAAPRADTPGNEPQPESEFSIGGWPTFVVFCVGLWLVESIKHSLTINMTPTSRLVSGLAYGLGACVVNIPLWSAIGLVLSIPLSMPFKTLRKGLWLFPMLDRASFGLLAGMIVVLFQLFGQIGLLPG